MPVMTRVSVQLYGAWSITLLPLHVDWARALVAPATTRPRPASALTDVATANRPSNLITTSFRVGSVPSGTVLPSPTDVVTPRQGYGGRPMESDILVGIGLIIVLGVGLQWLARLLHF